MSRRATLLLCAIVIALCAASRAQAKPRVAIAPFKGPEASLPEQAILKALRRTATVLSSARYALIARGVFAETQAAEDVAAVAKEMGATWVVTGTVKAEGARWSLTVSLRDGRDGQSRSKLRYPLPSPRCPPAVLRTLSREILDALAAAQRARPRLPRPPREPPRPPPEEPEGRDSPPIAAGTPRRGPKLPVDGEDDETPPSRQGEASKRPPRQPPPEPPPEPPPVRVQRETPPPPPPEPEPPPPPPPKPKATPAPAPSGRPRWARWFELGVGPSITGRSFSVDPPPPRFSSSVVAGVTADLTLYPLAFTWKNAYGLFSGLGLGATLDKPIWPDSTSRSDPGQRFPTAELRVAGGLRWKLTLYKPMPRPQLHLIVEGGLHQFTFAKDADGMNVVGVPDVGYVYLSIGGGLTVHFAEWSWIWVKFVYHAVTDTGPIQAPDQYGLSAAYGLKFSAGLDFLVYKGLRLGAQGFYERFNIVFGYDPNNRMLIADGATDEYYGAMVLLGYVL